MKDINAYCDITSDFTDEQIKMFKEINKKFKLFPQDAEPDPIVLLFIACTVYHDMDRLHQESNETIHQLFNSGYCYYFAMILKEAFQRGELVWCAPFSHICWMDTNGIPYDIDGVNYTARLKDFRHYIPIQYAEEIIPIYRHSSKVEKLSEEDRENIILRYEELMKIKPIDENSILDKIC